MSMPPDRRFITVYCPACQADLTARGSALADGPRPREIVIPPHTLSYVLRFGGPRDAVTVEQSCPGAGQTVKISG